MKKLFAMTLVAGILGLTTGCPATSETTKKDTIKKDSSGKVTESHSDVKKDGDTGKMEKKTEEKKMDAAGNKTEKKTEEKKDEKPK